MQISRRKFLYQSALATTCVSFNAAAGASPRQTKGVVLYPYDLSLRDWPERAHRAGLNTIALHAARRLDVLIDFIQGEAGQHFLSACRRLGLEVEYELHAMGELLSREWHGKDPTMFRLDARGYRNADANCCPHSTAALETMAEKAVRFARILTPTTHRYFYWPDDGADWCHCAKCKTLKASDQALLVENHLLRALKRQDAAATLAHISYHHTLAAPAQVKPAPGIFLEFAPIARDYSRSISDRTAATGRPHENHPDPATNEGYLDLLQANMELFGAAETQVLEYWLDVSKFSSWKRPAVKLPWKPEVCRADVAAYRKLGVRHITSFATYIDAEYVKLHGDPQPVLTEYGSILKQT
jgi:hypothetical protein